MKYNEDKRDDSSSAGHLAKGVKGVSKVQGLPHAHTNLIIDLFMRMLWTALHNYLILADISVKK